MAATASEKILGARIDVATAAQEHELGTVIECNDGTTRRYVLAGAAIAQYDALKMGAAAYTWIPSNGANIPLVGIAQIAVTSGYYFWAVVAGKCTVKTAAAIVASKPLVPTATAGTLDDTAADADNALAMAAGIGVISVTAAGTTDTVYVSG